MNKRRFFVFTVFLFLLFVFAFGSGCGGGGVSDLGNNDGNNQDNDTNASSFVVTFDSQGGTYIEEQIIEAGKTATVPDEPEKTENSFMGWYNAKGFSFRFDFNTPISKDITLYAKWWNHNDKTDTDGDGLIDSLENTFGTDINNPDTDDDGLTDYDELNFLEYNPLAKDTDGDGTNDGDEDADGDKLTNIQEGNYGTNMIVSDSDHDGLNDYEEIITYKTDPLKADTDGDGVDDGTEVAIGSNPLVKEETFSTTLGSNMTAEDTKAIDISVTMKSSAKAAGSLQIMPADYSFNPLINAGIPGYLAAYNLSADSDFDSATITFTLGNDVGKDEDEFTPAVYYFNESKGTLEKVDKQKTEGNKIIAEVSHFSVYVLINQVKYDEVWSIEIRPPSNNVSTNQGLDIVFVIDCSGSMQTNDPDKLALEMPKKFIENLSGDRDKAAVVKFDSNSYVVHDLTKDQDALKTAIDTITYYGPTNGSAGLNSALNILDSSNASYRYIVFLTDGEDNYYSYSYDTLIQRAKSNGIIIYTIGMGSAIENTLQQIASETGGAYFKATASLAANGILNLDVVYHKIEQETIDMNKDSNNDGISDYYTELMNNGTLPLSNGSSILVGVTDIFGDSDDWDGDGLKNGEEIKIVSLDLGNRIRVTAYMNSNPVLWDTDFDGYNDYKEVKEMHTSPLKYTLKTDDMEGMMNDYNFPKAYLAYCGPLHNPFFEAYNSPLASVFTVDAKAHATKTLINYFHNYATSDEVLSRDAFAQEELQTYKDKYDSITLVSDFIKLGKTAVGILNDIGSDTYTQEVRNNSVWQETVKTIDSEINAKKLDISDMNSMAKQHAIDNTVPLAERRIFVRSLRNNSKSFVSNAKSFFDNLNNFAKAENGKQTVDTAVKFTDTLLSLGSLGLKIGNMFEKVELPCKWDWMNKMSKFNKGTGGKILGGTIGVILTANELQTKYYEVSATYGQIAANCYEYQRYLALLRRIEQDDQLDTYVREAAGEIAGMFNNSGDPDWNEFQKRLDAARGKAIALSALKGIINFAIGQVSKAHPLVGFLNFLFQLPFSVGGINDATQTRINAQVYFAIVYTGRILFNELVNLYLDEESPGMKYAVQIAQSRIVGLDNMKRFLLNGKWWNANGLFNLVHNENKSTEEITTEFDKAIKSVYEIAKKCKMQLSNQLPLYDTYGK
ncbi:MAG: VWA domain-containing protein [Synergistaceae bacterium]|nr:VWA domain-containing protein [Synergistaceae bacterium]